MVATALTAIGGKGSAAPEPLPGAAHA
jgi:hypothetical protein